MLPASDKLARIYIFFETGDVGSYNQDEGMTDTCPLAQFASGSVSSEPSETRWAHFYEVAGRRDRVSRVEPLSKEHREREKEPEKSN